MKEYYLFLQPHKKSFSLLCQCNSKSTYGHLIIDKRYHITTTHMLLTDKEFRGQMLTLLTYIEMPSFLLQNPLINHAESTLDRKIFLV